MPRGLYGWIVWAGARKPNRK